MSARGAPQPRGMGLRNGLVLAALLIAALASGSSFAADNITLDDIGFQIGDTTYRLPRVEFVGPNLDRPQLRALFDANATQPLPARLAALSAKAVNVPELIAEWSSSEGRQTVSVRALSLQNVVAGRAARVSAGEVTSGGRSSPSSQSDRSPPPISILRWPQRSMPTGPPAATRTRTPSRAGSISTPSMCAPGRVRPSMRIGSR